MEDYEILHKTWAGGIPVQFRLNIDHITLNFDMSYFEVLPRMGYFYLELENALKFFSNNVEDLGNTTNAWLETQRTALKWHYPIGVLFDLYSSADNLPWTINIHLKDFPEDLVRLSTKDEKRNCFLQAVKEADQLKHRGNVVLQMKPDEHNKLFDSMCNNKFDDFRSINSKLRTVDNMLHVPIRFYKVSTKLVQQVLIKPLREDSSENQIQDAVKMAFPEENLDSAALITHGVLLPKETPLVWMARNLAYADNFVHVVINDE